MHALKRNREIDVVYFPEERSFDASKLSGKFDVILLPDHLGLAIPKEIIGITKLDIPVISMTSDSHNVPKYDPIECHYKYKIDYYFSTLHESYFYKFLPRYFKYQAIMFGVEPQFFQNLQPFGQRIKDKILNSGAMGKQNLRSRIVTGILKPKRSGWYFYKLRTMCNELPYVQHFGMKGNKYENEDYPKHLSQYRAAIAATTFYPSLKYLIIPAAGCLTFMEITQLNKGEFLGFQDNRSAIFINEKNYKSKFEEFINDPENSKWQEIANEGRNHSLANFTNDKGVEKLVALMKSLIH